MDSLWICDRGGQHWRGQDCDCPPDCPECGEDMVWRKGDCSEPGCTVCFDWFCDNPDC